MAIQSADLAEAMANISKLTTEELKEWFNSESTDKYDELVMQTERVKNLEAEREMLMASVRSLAEFNLGKQSDYESDRSKLLVLVGDSNKLKDEIQDKATILLELSKKTSLDTTKAIVLESAEQAERESDVISKSFLNSSIDYDTFISQFLDKRKLAHLRRIRSDRLQQETSESWSGIRSQYCHQ